MSQISSVLPSVLRQLKVANLQLKDFEVDKSASVTVGKKIFYPAIWSDQNVTLCVSFDQSIHVSKDEFHFSPIVDFIDDLPQDIMDQTNYPGRKCSRGVKFFKFYKAKELSKFLVFWTKILEKNSNLANFSRFSVMLNRII